MTSAEFACSRGMLVLFPELLIFFCLSVSFNNKLYMGPLPSILTSMMIKQFAVSDAEAMMKNMFSSLLMTCE